MGASTSKKGTSVFLVGPYYAGKSTILQRLKLGDDMMNPEVSSDWMRDTVHYKNISFTPMESGGRCGSGTLLRYFLRGASALIYVVDSSDSGRVDIAKYELDELLLDEALPFNVMLILANKQDLPNSLSVDQVSERLKLNEVKVKHNIFGTVATTGENLSEAMTWLTETLNPEENGHDCEEKLKENEKKKQSCSLHSFGKQTFKKIGRLFRI